MTLDRFRSLFGSSGKVLIGVVHLPALPGYPQSPGLERVVEKALSDLSALEAGGIAGVLVENEEDRPHRVDAAPETLAAMTRVARELVVARKERTTRIGVEILLNDPEASLAAAKMADASFIRTDYFVDPMERPEHGGAMRIDPDALLAYRKRIGAEDVLLLADVQVKYARMLVDRTIRESARLAGEKGADAIVVTGSVTGEAPEPADVEAAKDGADGLPVLVGSGIDTKNAHALLSVADGAIVGTSLKTGSDVDRAKVEELVRELRRPR
jgi:uncharacterized protein